MRFKLDENLPLECGEVLREGGHDVLSVHDQELSGAADSRVADACVHEKRALVSLDLDFADIRTYVPAEHSGLVVLRLPSQDLETVVGMIRRLLPIFEEESPEGQLWIVETNRVRIRE